MAPWEAQALAAAKQRALFSSTYARTTEREWGGRHSSPEPLPPPSQRRRRRYWHHQDAENPGAERPWVPLHSHKPTRLAVGFGLGEQPYRSPGPDSPLRAQEHTLVPPLLKLRTRLFYEACEHFTPVSDPCQVASEPIRPNCAPLQASTSHPRIPLARRAPQAEVGRVELVPAPHRAGRADASLVGRQVAAFGPAPLSGAVDPLDVAGRWR